MLKIVHQRDKCIGCGSCVSLCSQWWQMDEDGKASLKGASFDPVKKEFFLKIKKIDCHQDAVNVCPVRCIKISK